MSGFAFGAIELEPREASDHYLVAGATGSGKTRILLTALKSAHQDWPARLFVLDPKKELLEYLLGLGYDIELGAAQRRTIWLVNPFDELGSQWAMGRDITDTVSAHELASILVPHLEGKDNHFFDAATRDILVASALGLASFAGKPENWRLRDLLLACLYPGYCEFILDRAGNSANPDHATHAFTKRIYKTYLQGADAETVSNIRASVQSRLSIFEPAASKWADLPESRCFSLAEWQKGGGALILSTDDAARAATDPLVRAVFSRASSLLLSMADWEGGQGRTWVFLDEVRDAGRLDLLPRLLLKGRSKGVSVLLSFQDIDGLREVYGPHLANEMVGQCGNLALLRLSSPSTAQWAASNFGRKQETVVSQQDSASTGLGAGMPTTTIQRAQTAGNQIQEVARFLDSTFLFMPSIESSPENAIHGLYRVIGRKVKPEQYIPWDKHLDLVPPKMKPDRKGYSKVGQKQGLLPLWTADDMARLGFVGDPPNPFPNQEKGSGPQKKLL